MSSASQAVPTRQVGVERARRESEHASRLKLDTGRVATDRFDAEWHAERAQLMNLLAQQQRLSQAGLLTAGLAHEISNHIMVITGLAFAAERSFDPKRWRETLGKIQRQCTELSETMRTILSFSDRGTAGIGNTSFTASQVVADAVRMLRPLALSQGVAFSESSEGEARFEGDARCLTQALINLGSNAIRACAGGGSLKLRVTSPEAGICRFTVEDDGPGIPPRLRANVFDPFVTSQTDTNGHGLGLFIVRRAVVKLGGQIHVETSSAGTTFHVDLPQAGATPQEVPRQARTTKRGSL